jgi:hypothetical protein
MKTLLGLSMILFLSVAATAQDTTKIDPLLGEYILANSAEVVHIKDRGQAGEMALAAKLYDFDTGGAFQGGSATEFTFDFGLSTTRRGECIACDFDGDGKDEVFVAWASDHEWINMQLLYPTYSGGNWRWEAGGWYFTADTVKGPIRLVAATLAWTPRQAVVACYLFNDGFSLSVYDSIDPGDGHPVGTNYSWTLPSTMQFLDYDIAAGDFDRDGLDEIIFVSHTVEDVSYHYLDVRLFKYSPTQKHLVQVAGMYYGTTSGQWNNWKRLKVTTGDFRNLGYDEAVVSATLRNGNNGTQVFGAVAITPDPLGFNLLSILGTQPGGWTWGYGWETNAVVADLNRGKSDGDELVVAGPQEVAVLKFNSAFAPAYLARTPFINTALLEPYERRRFLAVADVDADTSTAAWMPEIVIAEHNQQDSTILIRSLKAVLDASDSIIGLTQLGQRNYPVAVLKSEIMVGDFDGDAVRVGAPKLVTVQNFYQPIVMLNVPPTHFDTLGGQVYDVCKVHGASPSEFRVSYTETQSQTSHFESEVNHSWGASAEISGGFSAFGFKLNAYAKVAYDGGYYGSRSTDTTTTASQVTESYGDDWILATVSDLDFWEYPVYAIGGRVGNFLVQIPHFKGTQWFPSRNVIARDWMADREVGNLFSYTPKDRISTWAGGNLLTSFTGKYVSIASAGTWALNLATQTIDANRLTHSIGAEVGLSVRKWGVEAKVSGRYSNEQIKTHTSTATKDALIEVKVSDTDKTFGDTDYLVTPYIYWGQNGALVVDYGVDPSSIGDPVLGTFWDKKYLSKPDPALILPWRLDSLKGIGGTENIRLYCKSLHASPMAPTAGDTVHITSNVHNFSLMNTAGPVAVRFYLGNPTAGGSPIVGIGGLTDVSTAGAVPARDRATVEMDWIVPSGLDNSARIYAAIDPDNAISEIHEDNNLGFVPLRVSGAVGVEEEVPQPLPELYVLRQNYPNPFNPSTVIQYELPTRSHVTLMVYDILGRNVVTLVNEVMDAGRQHVVFDGKGLATGMYLYRLQARPVEGKEAGGFTSVRKMLVVH